MFSVVRAAPAASPTVTAVNTTSTSLYLQWNQLPIEQRNGVIRGYSIQLRHTRTGITTIHNTTETSLQLMNLKPYSMYEYAIAAYTSVGQGPTASSQARTDEDGRSYCAWPINITNTFCLHFQSIRSYDNIDSWLFFFKVPSGPPENISGMFVFFNSFRLEWRPPSEEHRNGVITGYGLLLEWGRGQKRRVNTTDTHYTFTGLQQGTYYCKISAKTRIGTGPASIIVEATSKKLDSRVLLSPCLITWYFAL